MELEVTGIGHLEALPDEGALRIAPVNAEGQGIMLRLSLPAISQLILALASEGGKVAAAKPDQNMQVLFPAKDCDLAVTDDGAPILLVRLEGGLELPIQFETEALASLSSALALLKTGSSEPSH